nr:hypothetical protein CFP56_02952 [Quercus suber]
MGMMNHLLVRDLEGVFCVTGWDGSGVGKDARGGGSGEHEPVAADFDGAASTAVGDQRYLAEGDESHLTVVVQGGRGDGSERMTKSSGSGSEDERLTGRGQKRKEMEGKKQRNADEGD